MPPTPPALLSTGIPVGALRACSEPLGATPRLARVAEQARYTGESGTIRHVSLAAFPSGLERVLRGDFGESWLEVTAAGCGLDHGRPATLDLKKADVQLTLREEARGWLNPTVLVQVKTTVDLRDHNEDWWAYSLDAQTHDVLRRKNHQTRRILAVVQLSADGETLRMEPDGTLLVGRTTWASLEEEDPSDNESSQVVYLPKANVLDPEGLRHMLTEFGVPRSSDVPDVDEWGDGHD